MLVLSRLEDGRVEAYVNCNRRMLSPEEAMHLTRKPRPTAEPKPKQRARPNCIDDAIIDLVGRMERELLEKERHRREQQKRKEEQASESLSTAVPQKGEVQSRPRTQPARGPSRPAAPPEPSAPPPPALPVPVAPVQQAPAVQPEPVETAATVPPAATPPAELPRRRRPSQDQRIAEALQAFWERNRGAVNQSQSCATM